MIAIDRAMMTFSRLPQMRTAIRRLSRELHALKQRLARTESANSNAPSREDS